MMPLVVEVAAHFGQDLGRDIGEVVARVGAAQHLHALVAEGGAHCVRASAERRRQEAQRLAEEHDLESQKLLKDPRTPTGCVRRSKAQRQQNILCRGEIAETKRSTPSFAQRGFSKGQRGGTGNFPSTVSTK